MGLRYFLFFILISFNSFGATRFIQTCESHNHENVIAKFQIKWLKHFFETSDCNQIKKKLSQSTSFQEFLPRGITDSKNLSKWTDDFPYMYPIFASSNSLIAFAYQQNIDPGIFHKDFSLFEEFKNLTHIKILSSDTNVCTFVKRFPYIKIITTDPSTIIFNDSCLSESSLQGIILTSFQNSEWHYKTRIVGIERYTGNLESLKHFSDLKYLGIARDKDKVINEFFGDSGQDDELVAFNLMNQLTHFSMNVSAIKNINYLSSLKNLKYLALNCVDNEEQMVLRKCSQPYVKDIEFVSDLKRLQYLAISNSDISDLNPLLNLRRLKFLKLRANQISKVPNFSPLESLEYLDLSGNNIIELQSLDNLKVLKFLNISGNNVTNLQPLSTLTSLSFLNLSGNRNPVSIKPLSKLNNLKALNLSGEFKGNAGINNFKIDRLEFFKKFLPVHNSRYYWETIFEHYQSEKNVTTSLACSSKPLIHDLEFDNFPNLEMLSLRNNNITNMPKIGRISKLKVLDLQRNEIQKIDYAVKHPHLTLLDLSMNQFSSFPQLSGLKNIQRISLASNNLSTIDNVLTLPSEFLKNIDRINQLDLSNNIIDNFTTLNSADFENLEFDLWGNPIDLNSCNSNFNNMYIKQLCDASRSSVGKQLSHEEKKCLVRDY